MGTWDTNNETGTTYENSPNREAPNKHERGSKAYKEMIARDVKRIDQKGNLPFQFIKPPKRTQPRREVWHVCDSCYEVKLVNKYTVGHQCKGCNSYSRITEENKFTDEDNLLSFLESLRTEG